MYKIKPIQIGLISDPPSLVLVYEKKPSNSPNSKAKRRKRKMPLRDFSDRSKVTEYAYTLTQRHPEYLQDVLPVTIQKMLRVIQEVLNGMEIKEAVQKVTKEYEISGEEDLNKLSTVELDRRKEIMDEDFRKHLLQPGDPGYVYDKVVQFDEDKREPSAWDEDSEYEDKADRRKESETAAPSEPEIAKVVEKEQSTLKESESCDRHSDEPEEKSKSDSVQDIEKSHVDEPEILKVKPEETSPKNPTEANKPETVGIKASINSESEGIDAGLDIETGVMDIDDDEFFWT